MNWSKILVVTRWWLESISGIWQLLNAFIYKIATRWKRYTRRAQLSCCRGVSQQINAPAGNVYDVE